MIAGSSSSRRQGRKGGRRRRERESVETKYRNPCPARISFRMKATVMWPSVPRAHRLNTFVSVRVSVSLPVFIKSHIKPGCGSHYYDQPMSSVTWQNWRWDLSGAVRSYRCTFQISTADYRNNAESQRGHRVERCAPSQGNHPRKAPGGGGHRGAAAGHGGADHQGEVWQ